MEISTSLTRKELDTIAGDIGMELRDARAASSAHSVLLRPGAAMDDGYRVRGSNGRRVFAVTWEGHYVFMAEVFRRDPGASIKSALAHWKNAAHFFANAETPPLRMGHVTQSPMNWSPAR